MGIIAQLNIEAFKLADSVASPAMNSAMHVLTESFLLVLPLIVIYMLLKRDTNVFALVAAGILLYIVSDTLKFIVKEPRPCNVPELSWINAPYCESSYSFPSNHASVLTGLALFMGKYKYVRIAYAIWLVAILFSRIYLGLHYFTDIIAGATISLIISYFIYAYRNAFAKLGIRIFPFLKRWMKVN